MKLRRALQNLLGQVKQARDGFGIYQQSKSMDSAVKEAEEALASQPSAVFGPEPPLAAKLGETKFSDRWGRQWLFIDASNSLGNVLKAPPSELGIINREEIIATPSSPSAHELMLAVTKVKVAGLWKFDQPKWYEAMAEALLHLRQEATPSGEKPQNEFIAKRRSCNRHSNCEVAEEELLARNPGMKRNEISFSFHCYDDECPDCFGQ